ncbi:MAG: hypothetical protein HYZ74_02760, partial [Elusimicrobia bacterium]|nr:hypothetical protein [Elusimicrobiota bacterium]
VPDNPTVDIMHGDLECRYTFPWLDGRTVPFWNFPWFRANRESKPAEYKALFTDLNEVDVTEGQKSYKKVEESYKMAVQESKEGEVIMLNSACVHDLTGEDLPPLLQRHGQSTKSIYRASDGRDVACSTTAEMIRMALSQAAAPARDPHAVALLGYPGGRARRELCGLLTASGVRVAACVIPSLALPEVRRAQEAGTHVVMTHRLYSAETRDFLEHFGAPVLRPAYPYGVRGTRQWLEQVSRQAGRPSAWRKAWQTRWRPLAQRWTRMTREAQRYRLAFVLDPKQLPQVSDPNWTFGVPIVDMLKEMGFGIDYRSRRAIGSGTSAIARNWRRCCAAGSSGPSIPIISLTIALRASALGSSP